jgi:hypothetical protein
MFRESPRRRRHRLINVKCNISASRDVPPIVFTFFFFLSFFLFFFFCFYLLPSHRRAPPVEASEGGGLGDRLVSQALKVAM